MNLSFLKDVKKILLSNKKEEKALISLGFPISFFAEKGGFEPPRRRTDLSDFKSDTFSHLVTSPYQQARLYRAAAFLSRNFGKAS